MSHRVPKVIDDLYDLLVSQGDVQTWPLGWRAGLYELNFPKRRISASELTIEMLTWISSGFSESMSNMVTKCRVIFLDRKTLLKKWLITLRTNNSSCSSNLERFRSFEDIQANKFRFSLSFNSEVSIVLRSRLISSITSNLSLKGMFSFRRKTERFRKGSSAISHWLPNEQNANLCQKQPSVSLLRVPFGLGAVGAVFIFNVSGYAQGKEIRAREKGVSFDRWEVQQGESSSVFTLRS